MSDLIWPICLIRPIGPKEGTKLPLFAQKNGFFQKKMLFLKKNLDFFW